MNGALDEIIGEVEWEGGEVTISCNGWELHLSLNESKQLMEFLNNEIIEDTEDDN